MDTLIINTNIFSKTTITNFVKNCFNSELNISETGYRIIEKLGLESNIPFLLYGGDMVRVKDMFYMPIYSYTALEYATFMKNGQYPLVSKMIGIGCRIKGSPPHMFVEIETKGKTIQDKLHDALYQIKGMVFKKEKKKPVKRKDKFTLEGFYENHKHYVSDNTFAIIRDDFDKRPILNICKDKDEYYLSDAKGRVSFLEGCNDVVDAVITYLNNQHSKGLEDYEAYGILGGVPKSIRAHIEVEDRSDGIENKYLFFERRI